MVIETMAAKKTHFGPFQTRTVERIRRGVIRTFDRLESWSYLSASDRSEFRRFQRLFLESLSGIDAKVQAGCIHPLDLRGFPQVSAFPGYHINAGVFLGSFDPFQMSHLAMALRFLAAPSSRADVLFVVPEGSYDNHKPDRSEYRFRFEVLSLQLREIFSPLVVPIDIGEGAGTLEIVERLINLFPNAKIGLTHLLGSDSLPVAAALMPEDLEAWHACAARQGVSFEYQMFILARPSRPPSKRVVEAIRSLGVPVIVDRAPVATPSSSDLRRRAVFTILFPSAAVLRRVEVLFRYSMNRRWEDEPEAPRPEYEI